MRIKLSFVGLLLAAAVAAVGCGGGDKPEGTTSGTPTKESAAPSASAAPAATSAAPAAESAAPAASGEAAKDGEDGEKGEKKKGKKGKHGAKKKGKGGKGGKGKGGKGDDDDDDDDDGEVEGDWVKLKKLPVEVKVPKGWKEAKKKEWTIFKSPDGDAWLGFVEYDNPKEGGKKLEAVAEMFEVKDINWQPVHDIEVGEDHFKGKSQEGACKFGDGKAGELAYAAVDPPGKGQLLIVYVVKADGKPIARKGAMEALKSLRNAEGGGGKGKGGKGKKH